MSKAPKTETANEVKLKFERRLSKINVENNPPISAPPIPSNIAPIAPPREGYGSNKLEINPTKTPKSTHIKRFIFHLQNLFNTNTVGYKNQKVSIKSVRNRKEKRGLPTYMNTHHLGMIVFLSEQAECFCDS